MSGFPFEQRIKAWSFSRFSVYDKCPQQAKFKFIDKLQEPGSAAMDRGSAVHKKGEDYVAGTVEEFPQEYRHFEPEMKLLRKYKAPVESQWAFNLVWKPVDWFARDVYCRIKVDVHHVNGDVVHIIDHKTGRKRLGNELQMDLYGVGGFAMYEQVKWVMTELYYLDEGGESVSATYERKDYLSMRKDWDGRVKNMLHDTTFKPKPGNHCGFCHFRKANGGPCVF